MPDRKKVTLPTLFEKMAKGAPLTMITCYDYPMAYLLEQAGIDIILVGRQPGHDHARLRLHPARHDGRHDPPRRGGAPRRAQRLAHRRHALHELPALGRVRRPQRRALHGRGRLRRHQARRRRRDRRPRHGDRQRRASRSSATSASRPQSVSSLGGFRLQGKSAKQAKKIVDDAKALEDAGAFCILLELVPDQVCGLITERAKDCIIMAWAPAPTPTASS